MGPAPVGAAQKEDAASAQGCRQRAADRVPGLQRRREESAPGGAGACAGPSPGRPLSPGRRRPAAAGSGANPATRPSRSPPRPRARPGEGSKGPAGATAAPCPAAVRPATANANRPGVSGTRGAGPGASASGFRYPQSLCRPHREGKRWEGKGREAGRTPARPPQPHHQTRSAEGDGLRLTSLPVGGRDLRGLSRACALSLLPSSVPDLPLVVRYMK